MDDVLTELRLASDSLDRLYGTQQRRNDQLEREIVKLWADNAELRDEVHALANRIEANTVGRDAA